jgi:hydrogenase/urease accessory protein HupE
VIRRLRWIFLALSLAFLSVATASAHEVRPALLQITQTAPKTYTVIWKQPMVGDLAIHLVPHLSGGGLDRPPNGEDAQPGFRIKTWRLTGADLDGQTISVEGLSASVTDVLLRVRLDKGRNIDAVMRPAAPTYVLDLSGPKGIAVPGYLLMGVEHILTGFDHLLFVFGLFLLIGPNWRLVKAITAFTVAHSITLGLAALGFIHFPSAVIEAMVALSIVFVAWELVQGRKAADTLAYRYPWIIAFTFGLLHGLAFAGALADVGLPQGEAPQALFMFNLGVEIGQLSFIGVVLAATKLLEHLRSWRKLEQMTWARLVPAYLIGALSTYWLLERVATAVTVVT